MKNLRVNGLNNPIGYNMSYKRLTWDNLELKNKLLIITDDMDNVVHEQSIEQNLNSIDLSFSVKARTRYNCSFVDSSNEQIANCFFETGKLEEKWEGEWITTEVSNPIFTTEFIVSNISQSRFYICAKGIYQVKINGEKITDEVLLPGYYAYDLWQQSNTFDIEPYLVIGKNNIEITMTDGWFKGRLGFSGGAINQYGENLQFIAELYQNKKDNILASSTNWKVTSSNIVFSNIYDGEIQDYTKNLNIKTNPTVIKNELPIEDRMNNPIKKHETLIPEVIHQENNKYLLDFKQNFTGWIQFSADMKQDQYVKYMVGEILQDGQFYRENLRTAEAKFEYISDGHFRNVEPLGTFYGFRYALVETDAKINDLNLIGCAIYSQMDELGSFESNDNKINQLYSNVKWGQKSNFLDIPTDCPQRDERLGWTGDAQAFSITACLNYNCENFFRNYLYNMRKEQVKNNGVIPLFIPDLRNTDAPLNDGIAAWSDAGTIIPWNLYTIYRNKPLLAETYPLMRDWADFLISNNKKTGNEYLWQGKFQLGDWLALDNKSEETPVGGTDTTFIASIYFYISVLYTSKAAKELNNNDWKKYEDYANLIKTEIHNEYITKNGKLVIDTQTAYALIIEFELYEPAQLNSIKESFLKRLFDDKFVIKTGFIGTPIILKALEKIGLNQLAINMFENQQYPGWLYTVNLGATTIWERWNTVLPDGKINSQGMNSLNHYAYGAVANWMYSYLLGLKVDEKNSTIIISPNLATNLTNLQGSVHTLNGPLKIEINKQARQSLITVTIPAGYHIINHINAQELKTGENNIIVGIKTVDIENMTILQACSDYRVRQIIEDNIPFVFYDETVKINLDCKFKNIRDVIMKKRLLSEENLSHVLELVKKVINN